jgi:PadR family transcriptional regulator
MAMGSAVRPGTVRFEIGLENWPKSVPARLDQNSREMRFEHAITVFLKLEDLLSNHRCLYLRGQPKIAERVRVRKLEVDELVLGVRRGGCCSKSPVEVRRFEPWIPLDSLMELVYCEISLRGSKGDFHLMLKMDLLQGTLDMLVLQTLSRGPMHGFAIARWIRETTNDALQLEEGTLYPALYRMERKGWIASRWRQTENKRRARYYNLTAAGRKQLEVESEGWLNMSRAIGRIIRAAQSSEA